MKPIALGDEVRDIVSGFQGVATARIVSLTGLVQYRVQPPCNRDGDVPRTRSFDVRRIMVVGEGVRSRLASLMEREPHEETESRISPADRFDVE